MEKFTDKAYYIDACIRGVGRSSKMRGQYYTHDMGHAPK
jgi:hypothetical protein